ncbi:hypothetical protein N802_10795 [Knoellia sinensis KCTC 19936]|uniref:Phospholipase n=1 Tax=Knoellia sinensis KCTC 19936 TaxID=1385520 RepID=A0A0A0J5X3_9MICO|nr:hypothetical protein [Knoellia sinensis]KGN32174.1 hypothetical protein N802_10795 [Knoellia sinensis KCTC 19936]
MTAFAAPVVARAGSTDPDAPLVVLLHGRGSDETQIVSLADHVIPRELLDRTWDYLDVESGATTRARRDPGGHGITLETLRELGTWVGERVTATR